MLILKNLPKLLAINANDCCINVKYTWPIYATFWVIAQHQSHLLMNLSVPYLHMLLKVNSCSPNTSEPNFYKEKYRIQKIFLLQYIKSKRTFTNRGRAWVTATASRTTWSTSILSLLIFQMTRWWFTHVSLIVICSWLNWVGSFILIISQAIFLFFLFSIIFWRYLCSWVLYVHNSIQKYDEIIKRNAQTTKKAFEY